MNPLKERSASIYMGTIDANRLNMKRIVNPKFITSYCVRRNIALKGVIMVIVNKFQQYFNIAKSVRVRQPHCLIFDIIYWYTHNSNIAINNDIYTILPTLTKQNPISRQYNTLFNKKLSSCVIKKGAHNYGFETK